MIANLMSFSDNAMHRFGIFFDPIPDHEECGFDVVLGEHIKQLLGVEWVRSIIKGERDNPSRRIQTNDILPERRYALPVVSV